MSRATENEHRHERRYVHAFTFGNFLIGTGVMLAPGLLMVLSGDLGTSVPQTALSVYEKVYPFGWLGVLADVPGLEIRPAGHDWIAPPPRPGSYPVNSGDMLKRWTNDRFVSTMHRVVNPPDGAGATARRLSIPYFCMPNYDAVITCLPGCSTPSDPPRYEPVTSGDWVRAKTRLQVGAD